MPHTENHSIFQVYYINLYGRNEELGNFRWSPVLSLTERIQKSGDRKIPAANTFLRWLWQDI